MPYFTSLEFHIADVSGHELADTSSEASHDAEAIISWSPLFVPILSR